MMFEYTRIFQNKYLIKSVINKKQKPQNFIREIIPNGWKFSFFDNNDVSLFLDYIENGVLPQPIVPSKTHQLIKRDENIILPEFSHLLPYNKIGRDYPKNYLLISDSDVEYSPDDYDKICNISFDNNFNETFVEPTDEKTTNSRLYLPSIVLYGESTLEEFQHKYKLNETIKFLKNSSINSGSSTCSNTFGSKKSGIYNLKFSSQFIVHNSYKLSHSTSLELISFTTFFKQ
jgi:hypothetical protein